MQDRLQHSRDTNATMHQAVQLLAQPQTNTAGQCKTLSALLKRLTCSLASGDILLPRSQTVNVRCRLKTGKEGPAIELL